MLLGLECVAVLLCKVGDHRYPPLRARLAPAFAPRPDTARLGLAAENGGMGELWRVRGRSGAARTA